LKEISRQFHTNLLNSNPLISIAHNFKQGSKQALWKKV